MKRVFVTDCEGPISKNDNAFELAENYIPNGDKLFTNISKYDDVLADVLHKPDYSAGSTLKLILPFFKAYGLTDSQMEKFSSQTILLIFNTQTTIDYIQSVLNAFIVSTSYEHYIKALCKTIDFPFKNTYCTRLTLDKIAVTPQEKEQLRGIAQEITQMPLINIPKEAQALDDFSAIDQKVLRRLDEIFWHTIPQMFVGKFINDIVTIGGEQKAKAIKDAAERLGVNLADVMYVGDSITDMEGFRLVRDSGGLSVSFNGNDYAVRTADVAVIADSNLVIAAIADLFSKKGTKQTLETISSWDSATLKAIVDEDLVRKLFAQGNGLPKVQIVTPRNMESIIKESSEFRKQVRGMAVGRLG